MIQTVRFKKIPKLDRILLPIARQPSRSIVTSKVQPTPTSKSPSTKAATEKNKKTGEEEDIYIRRPSPPALEPKQQKEFINLLRKSSNPTATLTREKMKETTITTTHPDLINTKGPVEFDGDVNPNTGEVNGPKRDPLRWPNEWGYGGRATDF